MCAVVWCLALMLYVVSPEAAIASTWSIQPTPDPVNTTANTLSAVSCASRTTCTAVGYSTDIAGQAVTLAERWTRGAWTVQPTPNPSGGSASFLFGVSCVSGRACTAVGSVTGRDGSTVPLVERWSPAGWRIQRTPPPTRVSGGDSSYLGGVSCVSSTACTAVGYDGNSEGTSGIALIERWDGSRWAIEPAPEISGAKVSFLSSVSCEATAFCTATGFFINGHGYGVALAERWDGISWASRPAQTPLGASYAQLLGVSCPSTLSCTAVGYFSDVTGIEVMIAERLDATNSSLQATRYPAGARYVQFLGVSCVSTAVCTAVGLFNNVPGINVTLAERRDGRTWVIQRTPNPAGSTNDSLAAVSCPSARECIAVGGWSSAYGAGMALAERYS